MVNINIFNKQKDKRRVEYTFPSETEYVDSENKIKNGLSIIILTSKEFRITARFESINHYNSSATLLSKLPDYQI